MSSVGPDAPAKGPAWHESDFSLRDFLTVLFKRKLIIVAFFATTLVMTTLVTFLSDPKYEARAAILVKKASAEVPLVAKESSQLIISQVTEEELNSEVQILRSRQAFEETLRVLGVDESWRRSSFSIGSLRRTISGFLGSPRLSYFDEAVLELSAGVSVKPMPKSNVLEVSYRHQDPEWAARVVKALTEHYITLRAQVFQSPQAVAFFDDETVAAQARLSRAERALETYSREAGVAVLELPGDSQALAAEKEGQLRRLGEFERQLGEAEVAVRHQSERVAALEVQLTREPERLQSSQRINQDPAIEELERALVTLQLRRDALIQDFTPENRQVKDVDEQIRAAQARLKETEERLATINRTELNQVHQTLRSQLLLARADLQGAHARYDSLRAQVALQRRQLDDLNRIGLQMEELKREARAAEEAYLLYQKKHEEARISAAMEQQRIVNVSIAQPAQRPLRPVTPRKALNLILGLLTGLGGGLALAFVAEYLDHSFTTGREIEARLGIPLLGAIPDESYVSGRG